MILSSVKMGSWWYSKYMPDTEKPQKKLKRLTYRQKLLRKELAENGGSLRKAMVKVGYKQSYADSPAKLTSTQRWLQLMEKDLPDSLLSKTAKQGLKAKKWLTSPTEPDREVPDLPTRHKYLETALKMKGKLVDRVDTTSAGQQITGFTFIAPSKPEAVEAEIVDDN